jgi:hypothetical protein
MKYYADAVVTLDPRGWYEDLRSRVQDGYQTPTQPGNEIEEVAREALITCGLLEQAADDARSGECGKPSESVPAQAIATATDLAAEILAGHGVATTAVAALSAALERIARHYHGRTVGCVLPEGYAFYGVFPDLYIELGRTIAGQIAGGPVVVIGVRSIGTSLSAAVQAGLRQAGRSVQRFTVRPTGDPFARVTVFTRDQVARCRTAGRRHASFVVVDEGPGLSGSSIASVVQALDALGVANGQIYVACANRPEHLPMAGAGTHSVWQRVRWWAAQDLEQVFWQEQVPDLLARRLGAGVTLRRDFSWGAWSNVAAPGQPVLLPHLERRKLLVEIGGRAILAKYIGFGVIGNRKAAMYSRLAREGFVPPYRAYAHGLLLTDWVESRDARQASPRERQAVLALAARYYAFIFRHGKSSPQVTMDELAATVQAIGAAWLATTDFPALRTDAARAARSGIQAVEGDQRPEKREWLLAGDRILKGDAADHFLDHTWARSMDICFDLAGFALEWELRSVEVACLLQTYSRLSGDRTAEHRLPFFAAVYTAHRLATYDQAFHAARPMQQQAIDARRRVYGTALQQILTGRGDVPCASS